jgi:hypothetical protein
MKPRGFAEVVWWFCKRCLISTQSDIDHIPSPDKVENQPTPLMGMTCEEIQIWRIHKE